MQHPVSTRVRDEPALMSQTLTHPHMDRSSTSAAYLQPPTPTPRDLEAGFNPDLSNSSSHTCNHYTALPLSYSGLMDMIIVYKMQLLEHTRRLAPAQPQAKPTPGTPAPMGQPGI